MRPYPELRTARLLLRGFTAADAPSVQRFLNEWEVARAMLAVPYPYEDGMAEAWIASHRQAYETRESFTWAVVLREEDLVGSVALHLNARDENAELGYWIGRPYWGHGYATEAAEESVRFGFGELGLHRIHANHFGSNPASGKVMRNIGMTYEGTRPEHNKRREVFEDRIDYGLLARDWRGFQPG